VLVWEGEDWRARPCCLAGSDFSVIPRDLGEQPGSCHAEGIETRTLAEARAAYETFVDGRCYEGVILKHAGGQSMSGRRSHHRGKPKDYLALDSVLLGYNTDPERYLVGLWGDRRHTVLVSYRPAEQVVCEEEHERLRDYCRTHAVHDVPARVKPKPAPRRWVEPGLVVDVSRAAHRRLQCALGRDHKSYACQKPKHPCPRRTFSRLFSGSAMRPAME